MRKRTKNYDYYLPQVRTERDAKPLSKEQIENAGRVAMRLICDALEHNPNLRTQVKDFTKYCPKNDAKKIKDKRPTILFKSSRNEIMKTIEYNPKVTIPLPIEIAKNLISQ